MKVQITEIDVYEVDGSEVHNSESLLTVTNHWNRKNMVVIALNGKTITVLADDLRRAIDAAEKAHRY